MHTREHAQPHVHLKKIDERSSSVMLLLFTVILMKNTPRYSRASRLTRGSLKKSSSSWKNCARMLNAYSCTTDKSVSAFVEGGGDGQTMKGGGGGGEGEGERG